jgi:ADP-ribose pyrophosphatase YjhB (NUDIX family)
MNTDLHRVVVTAIINRVREGTAATVEYLIVQRSPELPYRPNEWTVPGGGVSTTDWHDETTQGEEDAYGVLAVALGDSQSLGGAQ